MTAQLRALLALLSQVATAKASPAAARVIRFAIVVLTVVVIPLLAAYASGSLDQLSLQAMLAALLEAGLALAGGGDPQ